MNGEERRGRIVALLRQADKPLSGSALAKELGVSRQIIVQDMALLRARRDLDILSTYQGYVLQAKEAPCQRVFRVRHSGARTGEELREIVDLGGRVEDVFVRHQVYGVVRGELKLASRRDVQVFLDRLAASGASPLMCLTDDVHFHTVTAEGEDVLDEIEARLEELGILAEEP